jgi:putative ABC transport system permease protein
MLADLRFSLRALSKNPGFTAIAVLTIALGIGANSAMFSVVNGVLLKPLPYRDANRVVVLQEGRPGFTLNISYANFMDWRARNQVFEDMALYNPVASATLSGKDGAEVLPAALTEPRLFDFLGLAPVIGRTFTPGEENAVLISDRLWKRRFGGDPGIVGKTIMLNGGGSTVIGILPPEMRLYDRDVWYHLQPNYLSAVQLERGNHPGFKALARLKPGVTIEHAQRAMSAIARDLEKQYPTTNFQMGVMLTLMLDASVGSVRPTLLMLFGAVAFVLLIACANVANLLLSRALGRGSEIAVRTALGASRLRLLRLFFAESLVLAVAGGALGIAPATWAIDGIKILGAHALPRVTQIQMNQPVLVYTAGLTLLTALLFSLLPAIQVSGANMLDGLKRGGRAGSLGSRQNFRWFLIAAEVALSVVLLTGAGLMIRTLSNLANVDPGFRTSHLLAVNLTQTGARYSTPAAITAFNENLVTQIRALPGVQSVARSWPFDLIGFSVTPYIQLLDKPVAAGHEPSVQMSLVSPDYFATMGIRLHAGRMFQPQDRQSAPLVAIVNEEFARRFYPHESPIGKRTMLVGWKLSGPIEIVGVVGDTLRAGLAGKLFPEFYGWDEQLPFTGSTILVRAAGDPMQLTKSIRGTIADLDPEIAMGTPVRVEEALWNTVSNRRFMRYQLMVFAGLALLLAVAGIYGVVSYSITQRTQEFGIRMALGAEQLDVIRLVLGRTAVPVTIGVAFGLGFAAVLTRYLSSQLYGVRTFDPITLAGVAGVLGIAALAGCWVPAQRAGRTDPLAALRAE